MNELKWINNKKAYYQILTRGRDGSTKILYLLKLNEAIENQKDTLIIRRNLNKNRVIISQTRYLELLKKEEKLNKLLKKELTTNENN